MYAFSSLTYLLSSVMFCHSQFQRFGKAHNTIDIFGTGAHVTLLATTIYQWFYLQVAVHIQHAYTFRP